MSTTLGPETHVRVGGSVYARPFGEDVVLLEFGRGEYFALDPIGADVWRALETGVSLGSIAEQIARAYDVSEAQALTDILALVHAMHARALVSY